MNSDPQHVEIVEGLLHQAILFMKLNIAQTMYSILHINLHFNENIKLGMSHIKIPIMQMDLGTVHAFLNAT